MLLPSGLSVRSRIGPKLSRLGLSTAAILAKNSALLVSNPSGKFAEKSLRMSVAPGWLRAVSRVKKTHVCVLVNPNVHREVCVALYKLQMKPVVSACISSSWVKRGPHN